MGNHHLQAGSRALFGGGLAGVAPSLGGPLLMVPALALLWSVAERPRWSAGWGLLAVLISHRWLLALHPLTWMGVPAWLSLPVALALWLPCGALAALLVAAGPHERRRVADAPALGAAELHHEDVAVVGVRVDGARVGRREVKLAIGVRKLGAQRLAQRGQRRAPVRRGPVCRSTDIYYVKEAGPPPSGASRPRAARRRRTSACSGGRSLRSRRSRSRIRRR